MRSGCVLGADDLDLVKYFQLRENWESKQYKKRGFDGIAASESSPEKVRRSSISGVALRMEKRRSGSFGWRRRKCQLRLRPTRSVKRMLPSVIWTEFQGENRPIWCFHLLFHPSFHPSATAKFLQNSRLARISAVLGDGPGDGKWAVATPLFDGNCRPGVLRVPRGFASLQGRHRPFLVPGCLVAWYYAGNTERTSALKNSVLPR